MLDELKEEQGGEGQGIAGALASYVPEDPKATSTRTS